MIPDNRHCHRKIPDFYYNSVDHHINYDQIRLEELLALHLAQRQKQLSYHRNSMAQTPFNVIQGQDSGTKKACMQLPISE